MAEAIGASNISQIMDLQANAGNDLTPAYAIYENGNPVRVALFNFASDPSGANDITASVKIGGGALGANATPAQVKVKLVDLFRIHFSSRVLMLRFRYLAASSVAQKYNFTWAGQVIASFHLPHLTKLKGILPLRHLGTSLPRTAASWVTKAS